MGHFRGSNRVQVRSRRKSNWNDGPGRDTAQTQQGGTGAALFTFGQQALDGGLTLVRTRGMLTLFISSGDAIASGYSGAFGIGICTAAAFAIGVTAVPTPIAERVAGGVNWIFWEAFSCKVAAANEFGTEASVVRIPVDSKAMRKLDEGDTIYAAIEATEVVNAVMQIHFDSRLLVKLS